MMLVGIATYFVLGIILGSFLNVVILRYRTGKSLSGRSACFACGTQLTVRELVPIVSYLFLKGRCVHCGSRISAQYILVELLTGLLFALVFIMHFNGVVTFSFLVSSVISLAVVSLLIVIAVYDMRHTIIPEGPVWLLILLSFVLLFVEVPLLSPMPPTMLALLSGPIISIPLALLWLFSRGKLMGLGDAKLALGIGWFLGFTGAVSALLYAFWIGAGVALSLLFLHKLVHRAHLYGGASKLTMKSEVPFAPFLVAGTLLVLLFRLDIVALLLM